MGVLVARPLSWIVRWLGVQTLLSLALLLVALGSVVLGLVDAVRGLDAGLLMPVAVGSVLLGWVLARSPLPGWLGGLLTFILGAEALLLRVGHLGGPLIAFLRSLAELAWGTLRWPLDGPPDGLPLRLALTELETGLSALLTRLRDWVVGGGFDPVGTALVWGLALWMVAAWAGWAVRRRNQALQAVTPAGALLVIALSYAWGRPYALVPLLGATLLLMALAGHDARERHWLATGTDFYAGIRFDLGLAATFLSLALLAVAILAPSVSVRPVVRFARRLMVEHLGGGEQVADVLGLEPGSGATVAFEPVRMAGLPRRHLLGSGPELSQQVVIVVYLESVHPDPDAESVEGPRYYWRGLTYDRYAGRGWLTGATETVAYKAGQAATFEAVTTERPFETSSQQTVRQRVRVVGDLGGLLHAAGELVTADRDYRVAWRSPGDAFGAQIAATTYRVDSRVPLASEAQLRSTGEDYPDWVRERYLALPGGVPERVLSLARALTANEPAPYDQARAIERYLRAFPYTLDLPAPPPDRDVVDYFLFELRQGYCDYYATAMVVLARAAGLPARLVTGYASGTYDASQARYVVTEADAHSWVEIYFPGYGWIEFEPTGGRPAMERPAETPPMEVSGAKLEPLAGGRIGSGWHVPLGLLGVLALVGLGGLAWWAGDGWRLRRMPPAVAVATLYQHLCRHGRRLAVPVETGSTPYEAAARLAGRVTELTQGRRWSTVAVSTVQEVRWLTDLYVRGLYSPHAPSAAEQAQAIRAWRRLRRQLWLVRMWSRLERLFSTTVRSARVS